MNPALRMSPRSERRLLLKAEARCRATGLWGAWEHLRLLPGDISRRSGWLAECTTVHRNKVFSVLDRPLPGGERHLAITSLSEIRPSWPEMQRIKDEIAGEDATAVEVYPPAAEIVDEANMYHLWILTSPLPFSLFRRGALSPSISGEPRG